VLWGFQGKEERGVAGSVTLKKFLRTLGAGLRAGWGKVEGAGGTKNKGVGKNKFP